MSSGEDSDVNKEQSEVGLPLEDQKEIALRVAEEEKSILAGKHEAVKETISAVGRKAFITTLIAIALNPLSVFLGYYITHELQKPKLSIANVDTNTYIDNHSFPKEALKEIKSNGSVSVMLREAIKQINVGKDCTGWIDEKPWIDECLDPVEDANNSLIDSLQNEVKATENNIKEFENWNGSGKLHLEPTSYLRPEVMMLLDPGRTGSYIEVQRGALLTMTGKIDVLNALRQALDTMRGEETPRTGDVELSVGILNEGEADGLVRRAGSILYMDHKVFMYADEFTVVKAHSFARIKFKIPSETQIPEDLNAWRSAIKSGVTIKYTIIVNPDDQEIRSEEQL